VEVITYSRISARARCAMREHLHYELRLRPRQIQWSLDVGSSFHAAMEAWNRGQSEEEAVAAALARLNEVATRIKDPVEFEKLPLRSVQLEIMVRAAIRRFPKYEPVVVEHEFSIPIVNPLTGRASRTFRLAGKIDAIVRTPDGRLWLLEYKTSGQSLDQFRMRYGLDNQISYYVLAARMALGLPIEGALVRVIIKPRTEPRRGETLDEYRERLKALYEEESDRLLSEDLVVRDEAQLELTRRELWAEVQTRLFEKRLGVIRRNPQACSDFGGCPFRAACLQLENWQDMYYVAEAQHDELSMETQTA